MRLADEKPGEWSTLIGFIISPGCLNRGNQDLAEFRVFRD